VADFIGETNLLEGKVLKKEGDVIFVQTHKGVRIEAVCRSDIQNEDVNISLRPEKVVLIAGETQLKNIYSATLEDIIYLGETTKFKLILEGQGEEIFLKLQNRKGVPKLTRGEIAKIGWDSDDMTVF
jgi:ABC-type Fe3+/spermidine/putrescine transport system ATPase subunit